MKIEDRFTVEASPQAVWQAITDPAVIAACLPGCDDIEMISPTAYRAAIRVEIGPIRTSFRVEVEVTEQQEPLFVRCTTRGEEGTRASMLLAHSEMALQVNDSGQTEVVYGSDVSVTGRLGKFGLGVMKKKAESLGRTFAGNFRARLEAS
jgi:carbon monoxide dehydrogenase subunit G